MPAEGINVKPSTDGSAEPVAVDVSSDGKRYQLLQPVFGTDGGAKTPIDNVDGQRLPVGGDAVGLPGETAPASDIASSGLNGRLQRIAQRLTTLIGLLPTSLGQKAMSASLAVVVASDQSPVKLQRTELAVTVSVASGQTLSAAVDIRGYTMFALIVPSTFDGTQIQFQGCDTSGGTYQGIYTITNARVIMTVAASRSYDLPGELGAFPFIKIECLTAQATSSTDFVLMGRS